MGRQLLTAIALLLLATSSAGCLRQEFDLCAKTPPHPDCLAIDASVPDGALDAAARDAAAPPPDAGPIDAPSGDGSVGDASSAEPDGGS